jgi:hypothetical protein
MTDERDKPSRNETSARVTARDVPFTRDAGSEAEPVPRARRPQQLPRDPTYEAELAQVELAVLRNPERRDDPSTKQGGRRTPKLQPVEQPDSVTPESPLTRSPTEPSPSPLALGGPPSSGGRASAGGTLLSIGGVDPRAKTERTLETPRMFFSDPTANASGEVYFKPGKIPAVTVHQTQEMETVKLADSIDPRRAKTIPRLDRHALQRYADSVGFAPESAAPMVLTGPGSNADAAMESTAPSFAADDYEPVSSLGEGLDGQIHASLSPFREHAEPSYGFDGVPTRAEPLGGKRGSEAPSVPAPDTSAVPTHRDLPQHRIEASLPPPPPVPSFESLSQSAPTLVRVPVPSGLGSEAPDGTSASIAAAEPRRRPAWVNLVAFAMALLVTIIVGLWLTRRPEPKPSASEAPSPLGAPRAVAEPPPPAVERAPSVPVETESAPPVPEVSTAPLNKSKAAAPRATAAPAADTGVSSRKNSPPKSSRETIF